MSVRVMAASLGIMVGAREARLLKDLPRDARRIEKGVVLLLIWVPSSLQPVEHVHLPTCATEQREDSGFDP